MLFKSNHRSTVSAIVYSIIRDRFPIAERPLDFPNNRAVQFLLDQQDRMADYLRWPLVGLTLAFDWSSFPRYGRRFHTMSPAIRTKKVEAWRGSRLMVCRDFVRFYDSLVVFYWYSKVDRSKRQEPAMTGTIVKQVAR